MAYRALPSLRRKQPIRVTAATNSHATGSIRPYRTRGITFIAPAMGRAGAGDRWLTEHLGP